MQAGYRNFPLSLIVAERIFALFFVAILTACLPGSVIFYVAVTMGYAHFLLAYVYKWRKKPFSAENMTLFAIGLTLSFLAAYRWPSVYPIVVGVIFTFHSTYDDIFLSGRKVNNFHALTAFVLSLLFINLLSSHYLSVQLVEDRFLPVFPAAVFLFFSLDYRENGLNAAHFWVLFLATFIVVTKMIFNPHAVYYYGFIIIMHYINWYVKVGYAKWKKPDFKNYAWEVFVMNAVFVTGMIVYLQNRQLSFLYHGIYGEKAFFAWTTMHILATLRLQDFGIKKRRMISAGAV